jgi:hypothetical protein
MRYMYALFLFLFINFESSDLHFRGSNSLETNPANVQPSLASQMSPVIAICSTAISLIYVSIDAH